MNPSSIQSLLTQFRSHYPMGCIVSELLTVHDGRYVVRATLQLGTLPLATGLAAASEIEIAEDQAKARAIAASGLLSSPAIAPSPNTPAPNITTPSAPLPRTDVTQGIASTNLAPSSLPPLSLAPLPLELETEAIAPASAPEKGDRPSPPTTPPTPAPVADLYAYTLDEAPEDTSPPPSLDEIGVVPLSKLGKNLKTSPSRTKPQAPPPALDIPIDVPPAEKTNGSSSVDLSEVLAQIDVEMMRLGWTKRQGREHLKQHYGKATRPELDVDELFDFLHYLQAQPSTEEAFS